MTLSNVIALVLGVVVLVLTIVWLRRTLDEDVDGLDSGEDPDDMVPMAHTNGEVGSPACGCVGIFVRRAVLTGDVPMKRSDVIDSNGETFAIPGMMRCGVCGARVSPRHLSRVDAVYSSAPRGVFRKVRSP